MRLNESQSLFAQTLCLCQRKHIHASMRYADANGNRRSVCACSRVCGVEWNATKLKVICMQSSVDFFLSLSLVFSTLWYDDGDDMNLIGSVCQNWFHSNLNVSVPSAPPPPNPSSTELYIFKCAHFDIQNTELITMTSRQIKPNALNAVLNTLLLFKLAVKKKIVFFFFLVCLWLRFISFIVVSVSGDKIRKSIASLHCG